MPGGTVEAPRSMTASVDASLGVIVPLAPERRCLRPGAVASDGVTVSVHQSGQGPRNATRVAAAAIANGATALLSVGVAGALSAELEAGDVVVPGTVIDAASGATVECAATWTADLRAAAAASGTVSEQMLLSVSAVLTTPEKKRAAAARFGAVACDMESAAIGAVAAQAGVAFAVLRVICDNSADELPDNVEGFVDDTGNARLLPVIGAMMVPGRWRSVLTMNTRFRQAQRRLNLLSDALAPSAYCCPGR